MKAWWRAAALAWLAVVALMPAASAQTATHCPPEAPGAAELPAADGKHCGLLWRLTRDGRSSYLFASMHPLLQAMSLTLLELKRQGLHPAFGQEAALKQFAVANNKSVLSLETPAQLEASCTAAISRSLPPSARCT